MERALVAARDELFRAGEHDATFQPVPAHVDWADAFLAMADRSLGGAVRPQHDRNLVLLHVGTDAEGQTNGHLHLGSGLSAGLRRFLGCDARIRADLRGRRAGGQRGPGLSHRPERTRIVIEERDGGCRVPGCDRSRWLHIHHLRHWEDGGGSDTGNLIALCRRHHRLHHLGQLGIEGNADDPDGVSFTDDRGRPLEASGRPKPPGRPIEEAARDLGIPAGRLVPPHRRTTRTGAGAPERTALPTRTP